MSTGRNSPCPCGSGKKYKKCCLTKQNNSGKLDKEAHLKALKKSFAWKRCLHPDKAKGLCHGDIVQAHTIPRYLLKLIAVNSEVYVPFSVGDVPYLDKKASVLKLQGIGKTTTFTGFCEYHDREVFSPIENHQIELIPEHIFLVMYRAICHEMFTKTSQVKSSEHLKDNLLYPESGGMGNALQGYLESHFYSTCTGLKDIEFTKSEMDKMLISKNYHNLEFAYFKFDQVPALLVSACTNPFMDFIGNDIIGTAAYDPDVRLGSLCCSILPISNYGVVLFSWLKGSKPCEDFIASLLSLEDNEVPTKIILYVFSHFETFAINPLWWDGLDEAVRSRLVGKLVNAANPFTPIDFKCLTESLPDIVTWKVTHRYKQVT